MRYFKALMHMNLKTLVALRATFILRSVFMIFHHGLYLIIWFVFFDYVPTIGGWTLNDVLTVYGMGCIIWGLTAIFFYGIRFMARQIDDGLLDIYLAQPQPVLLNIAIHGSQASGGGEVVMGLFLLAYTGALTLSTLPLVLFLILCGGAIFMCLFIIMGSTAFWARDMNEANQDFYYHFFLLSNRPEPVFQGITKIIIYTIVPVGFMTFIPLRILTEQRWDLVPVLLAGVAVFAGIAVFMFRRGLRRYTSGNRFITAAGG